MGRGRPCFPPDFACPAVLTLMTHPSVCPVTYRTLTFSGPLFQYGSARAGSYGRGPCWILPASRSTPPQQRQQPRTLKWFGLLPVRSPLLRESSLFLGVREMFQFPRFPPLIAESVRCLQRGLPHSDSTGSSVASTSPARFAAWPRPSSAANAKASTMRSSSRRSRPRPGSLPKDQSRRTAPGPAVAFISSVPHRHV